MPTLQIVQTGVDLLYSLYPRSRPTEALWQRTKLIAHRGAHQQALENTLPAFAACLGTEIDGVEFDIRWTREGEPVVLHDRDAGRVFGRADLKPGEMTFAELRRQEPRIPHLEEVLALGRGHLHLMIEVKEIPSARGVLRLKQLLADWGEPARDFHFLALNPSLFTPLAFAPRTAFLPVAELNVGAFSRWSLAHGAGGVTGHYLLLTDRLKAAHNAHGQTVGTGFIDSMYLLYREVARGIPWVFSDRALAMAEIFKVNRRSDPALTSSGPRG